MKFTVLSIAYPFAAVGTCAVGGAEQVLTLLEAELVARGYGSIVIAREGSTAAGRLLATAVPDGVITAEVREAVIRAQQANIDLAFRSDTIDLVHMHGIDFDLYHLPAHIPVLVTLHLPPSWYPREIWRLPSNYQLQCVSETQRLACPAEVRERLAVVENGVPLRGAEKLPKRRNYALMLSRICPEKNLHTGLEAARMCGVPVLLAGETFAYAEHLRYLREEIEPRLSDRARLLGPVGGAEKTRLLARARCLLLPTLAPETSSLVAMEAMAVGTPVVAYGSGAIPEIVEHGRTGFIVSDAAEMAAAIERAGEIDPAECMAVAASRFPLARMVQNYLELYRGMPERRQGQTAPDPRIGSAPAAAARERTRDTNVPLDESGAGGHGESAMLTVSVGTTVPELEALVPEWKILWLADMRAAPFQSPEWLLPWWKHVGEGELFTLSIRDRHGRLVGLLPLYIHTQAADGERLLLLLGAGTSDYLDGLFAADAGIAIESVAETALAYLGRCAGRWDRDCLHQMRMDSPLIAFARRAGWPVHASEPCSSVLIEGWPRLPAKIRLNSGRYRRRAEARGKLNHVTAVTRDEAKKGLEDLIALHTKRWRGDGVLRSAAVQRHHRESVPALLEAGLLRMLSLEIDGDPVAVLYALIDSPARTGMAASDRRMYCYLMGFDPELADLSPGTLLLSFAFKTCEAEGLGRMDLLRGGEGYKQLWGAVPEPTSGFTLSTAGGNLVRALT